MFETEVKGIWRSSWLQRCGPGKWVRVGRKHRLFICRPECLQVYSYFLFTFFVCWAELPSYGDFLWWAAKLGFPEPYCCSTCNVLGERGGMRCWVQKRRYAVSMQPRWETKVEAHATTTTTIAQTTIPTIISHDSRYCGLFGSGFGSKFLRKLLS